MKDWIKGGLIAFSVIIALIIGASAIGVITMPFRTGAAIIERTFNADNVIRNYEWFKRQYQDIKAIDVKIKIADETKLSFEQSAGNRETWKFEDRQEWNRLNNVSLGLKGQRASMVAEYNAKTQMANRDLFRTSDLPAEIF